MSELKLRVAAWYGDTEIALPVPGGWELELRSPATPVPLSAEELAAAIAAPVGAPRLRELAAGCRRPVILLDDLTRPTPAAAVVPLLLDELGAAGVARDHVTILVGGGTHRPATREAALKKAGSAAAACRLLVHQPRPGVRIGRTSFGSPVLVDPAVAAADLVLGIGGVYPQHSVGFGGGSKLLLGALAQRSITALHYGHPSVGGTYDAENDFRRDLDEMAAIAGLRWTVSLHVDGDRRIVRAAAGDPLVHHAAAAAFALSTFAAPLPDDADVVVANAYPMDVSLTFARSKGLAPLYHERRGASRILIAACPEGLGYHGLFPYLNGPRLESVVHRLRRLSVIRPAQVPAKLAGRVAARLRPAPRARPRPGVQGEPRATPAGPPRRPVRLFVPGGGGPDLPPTIPGVERCDDWARLVREVEREQGGRRLRVAVYTCAPLQCLQFTGLESTAFLATALA